MKVKRQVIVHTDQLKVGDQIDIKLKGFGKFTATVHKVDQDTAELIFDNCVTEMPLSEAKDNEWPLSGWMDKVLYPAFHKKLRKKIQKSEGGHYLRLPAWGELFDGERQEWVEEDPYTQLELMKNRKYRVCSSPNNEYAWYWILNRDVANAAGFCNVGSGGYADCLGASDSIGVRPVFEIKYQKSPSLVDGSKEEL